MFFNSIEKINRLRKEINRLLSKATSNIYLKVTIKNKWSAQNFDFKSLKTSSSVQHLGSSNSRRYHWFWNFLLQLKNQIPASKTVCGFFFYYYFERNFAVLKSKTPCFLYNKNKKFNKSETETKMENPIHSFRGMTHVLDLI